MWEEGLVNGDVHGSQASCGSVTRASRFLIGLVTCFATHDSIPAVTRRVEPVGTGRHTDQAGEATAEAAQRRAADRETDLGAEFGSLPRGASCDPPLLAVINLGGQVTGLAATVVRAGEPEPAVGSQRRGADGGRSRVALPVVEGETEA
jgi:hypothetical protein